MLVDTLFYFGATGMPPQSPEDVGNLIRDNYADYLYYINNVVTFDWLKNTIGSFPPEMVGGLMQALLPYTYTDGYDLKNSLLYTNRLRLQMDAKVAKNIDFQGRLSMYKAFGDSTGVQVFNGQPTSINVDGTTASRPQLRHRAGSSGPTSTGRTSEGHRSTCPSAGVPPPVVCRSTSATMSLAAARPSALSSTTSLTALLRLAHHREEHLPAVLRRRLRVRLR